MGNPTAAKMIADQNEVQIHEVGAQQANDATLVATLGATSAANQSRG